MKVIAITNSVHRGLHALLWMLWAFIALLCAGLPRTSKAEESELAGASSASSLITSSTAAGLSVLPGAYSDGHLTYAAGPARPSGPPGQTASAQPRRFASWDTPTGSIGPLQLVAPIEHRRPGSAAYQKPRFALVFHSNGLKRNLEAIGLKPQSCKAPVIRLRGKLKNGNQVNGSFWIFARCALW